MKCKICGEKLEDLSSINDIGICSNCTKSFNNEVVDHKGNKPRKVLFRFIIISASIYLFVIIISNKLGMYSGLVLFPILIIVAAYMVITIFYVIFKK